MKINKNSTTQELTHIVPVYSSTNEDEMLSLKEIVKAFWVDKYLILLISAIGLIISFVVVISLEKVYTAEIIVTPTQNTQNSSLSSLSSQFSGIASLAGIQMNNQTDNKIGIALETIRSKVFLKAFVERHSILIPLLAAKTWNNDKKQLSIDEKIYNREKSVWLDKKGNTQPYGPDSWDIQKKFDDSLEINENKSTGLIKLSFSHYSPRAASNWLNMLIEDINNFTRETDTNRIKQNILYLQEQLKKTNVVEMQRVFFNIIEEQTKELMLTQINDNYIFTVIEPAIEPKKPSRPQKVLLIALGFLSGLLIGVMYSLIKLIATKLSAP
ncbi:Wzz/FepE/Etk N-terminal domain-containing protein [Paraglaciecola aquimarina]|uniref:Wzz/FepE/Etk N-terminal domain-containing protein n=1 Tax=Paraglaciecola algarum TaxID=3050085 RepID=A0ABS9D8V2_9ALTE|nr:Wzz/FepE/Etk N-terminal domain-containing protein [Paraglaciecola sp. G1-23]MCF2948428.1 Wzz/FepE/Etk N-terminal domain-containing protein [Paraglaciecola sp. G1-23]